LQETPGLANGLDRDKLDAALVEDHLHLLAWSDAQRLAYPARDVIDRPIIGQCIAA
jgi:hypothetical protein